MDETVGLVLFCGVPAGLAVGAGLAGGVAVARGALRRRSLRAVTVGVLSVSVLLLVSGVVLREDDVQPVHAFGWLFVALLMVMFGATVSFGAGWLIGGIRGKPGIAVAVVAWGVLLAPASVGMLFVWLIAAYAMNCPPDAYECPV